MVKEANDFMDWVGYALRRAAHRINEAVVRELEPLGIHPRHYAVLLLLSKTGPLSQQEIGRELGIDRTTMVHIIDDLEERGLVVRARDPLDRRKYAVGVTDDAQGVLERASAVLTMTEDRFLAPLDAAERRRLHNLLQKLL